MCTAVAVHQIPPQFLVHFLCSVCFHFLFFMFADLLLLWSEVSVLRNFSSGSFLNSIQVELNHKEKLSILMKTCFSSDVMHTVAEGSVINNMIMCLDFLDVNAPDKTVTPKEDC
jgi:hypothetical protein